MIVADSHLGDLAQGRLGDNGRSQSKEVDYSKKERRMTTSTGSRVEPSLVTVGVAAELLHVHPNTVRRWESLGLIMARRVGPRQDRRFLLSEVLELLQSYQQFTSRRVGA